MFEFIGGIFSFAFGMIKMGLGLAWGAVQFVVGCSAAFSPSLFPWADCSWRAGW